MRVSGGCVEWQKGHREKADLARTREDDRRRARVEKNCRRPGTRKHIEKTENQQETVV